jgi:hypothetical protein
VEKEEREWIITGERIYYSVANSETRFGYLTQGMRRPPYKENG